MNEKEMKAPSFEPRLDSKLTRALVCLGAFAAILAIHACGVASGGDRAAAVEVNSPVAGYRCFAIQDWQGHSVGGGCVKDN